MGFNVEFTSGATTDFDDLARYHLDESGCLHITTPERRMVYASHAWSKVVEVADPREPSSLFV
ncbi:MAG: hypothetical protein ABIN79_00540 [Marmoricola sp.]